MRCCCGTRAAGCSATRSRSSSSVRTPRAPPRGRLPADGTTPSHSSCAPPWTAPGSGSATRPPRTWTSRSAWLPLTTDPGARPAVAASGARLPLSLVKQWWCDAHITRYVLGLGHRVLAVSHTEGTLKAHERRAKKLQTAGVCHHRGLTITLRDGRRLNENGWVS